MLDMAKLHQAITFQAIMRVHNLKSYCMCLQGHALFTRQAGSTIPCPLVDFDGGFNAFMGAAFGLSNGTTVEDQFGAPFGEPLPSCCTSNTPSWHALLPVTL